jgi:hypothetical protein
LHDADQAGSLHVLPALEDGPATDAGKNMGHEPDTVLYDMFETRARETQKG